MALSRQIFLATMAASCIARGAELQFSATPPHIGPGESATLNWRAPPGRKTVLLGTGDVAPSGSIQVSPPSTSSYTLVSDGPDGFSARTITIEVGGSRGADFPSDEAQFRYPLSDRRAVHSKSEFLEKAFSLLQNELAFSVRTYTEENGVIVFLTNSAEQADLVGADERRRMRARRISFRLEVADRPGQLAYTIKSLIEFQLRAEETWRKDDREDLYRRKGGDLLMRLAGIP
jgi:hypothetical protein